MTFTEAMHHATQLFEAIGVVVLLGGFFVCVALTVRSWRRTRDGHEAYQVMRQSFGGVILLGVEVLVAADLIYTVTVAPTLANVGVLGLVVLIRTFLSFSLEIEMDGVAPWRRAAVSGVGHVRRSAAREDGVPPDLG